MDQKILYSDLDNEYLLLDYHPTHAQLLFRRKTPKISNLNLDVVFKPIKLLFIPDRLEGIEIRDITNDLESLTTVPVSSYFSTQYGNKIFRISDKSDNMFYINASACGVFENSLPLLKSSLGDFLDSEQNKCLFWYS